MYYIYVHSPVTDSMLLSGFRKELAEAITFADSELTRVRTLYAEIDPSKVDAVYIQVQSDTPIVYDTRHGKPKLSVWAVFYNDDGDHLLGLYYTLESAKKRAIKEYAYRSFGDPDLSWHELEPGNLQLHYYDAHLDNDYWTHIFVSLLPVKED